MRQLRWTRKLPRWDGYYWIRFLEHRQRKEEIVQTYGDIVWWNGSDICADFSQFREDGEFKDVSWMGPIGTKLWMED